jgi:hypothetical protein
MAYLVCSYPLQRTTLSACPSTPWTVVLCLRVHAACPLVWRARLNGLLCCCRCLKLGLCFGKAVVWDERRKGRDSKGDVGARSHTRALCACRLPLNICMGIVRLRADLSGKMQKNSCLRRLFTASVRSVCLAPGPKVSDGRFRKLLSLRDHMRHDLDDSHRRQRYRRSSRP